MTKYVIPVLSVVALLCFVAGTAVTALWLGGPLAAAGLGLLATCVACLVLAWQADT